MSRSRSLGLLEHEDEGSMLLRNVGSYLIVDWLYVQDYLNLQKHRCDTLQTRSTVRSAWCSLKAGLSWPNKIENNDSEKKKKKPKSCFSELCYDKILVKVCEDILLHENVYFKKLWVP